ncbi:hypothetical protein LA262_004664 [Vibrio parahaemolyticus]|nr:hypothetical protein [Vibrio parahaemolyticus]
MTNKKKRIIHFFRIYTSERKKWALMLPLDNYLSMNIKSMAGIKLQIKIPVPLSGEKELAAEVAKLKRQFVEHAEVLDIVKKYLYLLYENLK